MVYPLCPLGERMANQACADPADEHQQGMEGHEVRRDGAEESGGYHAPVVGRHPPAEPEQVEIRQGWHGRGHRGTDHGRNGDTEAESGESTEGVPRTARPKWSSVGVRPRPGMESALRPEPGVIPSITTPGP